MPHRTARTQFRRQVINRVGFVLAIFILVTGGATVGFMMIEQLTFFDALYMAVITFTTVGYGDVVPSSSPGRIFAMLTVLFGLLGTGISVGVLADLIFEKAVMDMLRGRKLDKRMNQFKDHFIVCGYGVTGKFVVNALLSNGEQVVVIDTQALEHPGQKHLIIVEGDARKDDVLRRAGIERAKGLAAALQSDADNVFVVLTARSLNERLEIVSRFKDEDTEKKLYAAGANRAVSPYRMGGKNLFLALTAPVMAAMVDDVLLHKDPAVTFSEVDLPTRYGDFYPTLARVRRWCEEAGIILVAAYGKDGQMVFNPNANVSCAEVNRLLVLGELNKNMALGRKLKTVKS